MKHVVALGALLLGIWLLWSGHYSPLLIGLGLASCLLVVLLARRMEIVDEEAVPVGLALRALGYLPWLIKEIVVANLDVAWRILHPRLPIRPMVIRVKASQRSELARVVYANSITLTPGTVSIDLVGDVITVHALSSAAAEFDQRGEMDRRVSALEGRG